jgi:hypothetical protein
MGPNGIEKNQRRKRDRFRNHPQGRLRSRNIISNTGEAIGNVQSQCLSVPVPLSNDFDDINIARNENSDEVMSGPCEEAARYTIGNHSRQLNGISDARVEHLNEDRGLQNVDNSEELRLDADEHADSSCSAFMTAGFIQEELALKSYGEDVINECEYEINEELCVSVEERSQLLANWQTVCCLLVACGTVRLSKAQFDTFRSFMNWRLDLHDHLAEKLPSFSKLQNVILRTVRKYAWARSFLISYPVSSRLASISTHAVSNVNAPVRFVPPSSWARLDVLTSSVYNCISECVQKDWMEPRVTSLFQTIEESPIVRTRRQIARPQEYLFANLPCSQPETYSLPVFVTEGSVVDVRFDCSVTLFRVLLSCGLVEGPYDIHQMIRGTLGPVRIFKEAQNDTWDVRDLAAQGFSSEEARLFDFISSYSLEGNSVLDPADIFVPVRFPVCNSLNEIGMLCLIVYHAQRKSFQLSRNEFLTIYSSELARAERKEPECFSSKIAGLHITSENTYMPQCTETYAPNVGRLKDGKRYIVYRMLLYCDDFQPYTTRKGSAGGCYMLPLGVTPRKRSGYGAVRVLGLTPPGISTNVILSELIKDIVKGSTQGFASFDADGSPITIFLDIVGFIGDYPAVTHVNDLLGHTACSPCHLCTFQREDGSGTGASRYAYTSRIHARSPSFVRTMERMKELRSTNLSPVSLRELGLNANISEAHLPLHRLAEALNKVSHLVPVTDQNIPVVPAVFDPYQSCFVAPDHLLSGMAKDVLNACICSVTPQVRRTTEILIKEALSQGHLLNKQNRLFSASPPSLLSMTLSDVFCVLLVSPICFMNATRIEHDEEKSQPRRKGKTGHSFQVSEKARALLLQFQVLVARTYYLPSVMLDGADEVHAFNREGGRARFNELYVLACKYLKSLDGLCRLSEDMRKHLDKPNAHRLLELYAHTLPAFGHVHHIQELVFESAHQPLKRGIRSSNHRNEQVFAVSAALASDWESRLAFEVEKAIETGSVWDADQCIRIERLLLGEPGLHKSTLPNGTSVQDIFQQPVLSELSSIRRRHCRSEESACCWGLEDTFENESEALKWTQFSDQVSLAIDLYKRNTSCKTVQLFRRASRFQVNSFNSTGRITMRRHTKIQVGSILHVICAQDKIMTSGIVQDLMVEDQELDKSKVSHHACSSLWKVIGLIENNWNDFPSIDELVCTAEDSFQRDDPVAIVLPCNNDTSNCEAFLVHVSCGATPKFLRLSMSVRETMHMHFCRDETCCFNPETGRVEHGPSEEEGGQLFVYSRTHGYPPRIA